jgi:hypothetical protein
VSADSGGPASAEGGMPTQANGSTPGGVPPAVRDGHARPRPGDAHVPPREDLG